MSCLCILYMEHGNCHSEYGMNLLVIEGVALHALQSSHEVGGHLRSIFDIICVVKYYRELCNCAAKL